MANLPPGAKALQVVRDLHGHDAFVVEKEEPEGIAR
jgi:hypothetical protein